MKWSKYTIEMLGVTIDCWESRVNGRAYRVTNVSNGVAHLGIFATVKCGRRWPLFIEPKRLARSDGACSPFEFDTISAAKSACRECEK